MFKHSHYLHGRSLQPYRSYLSFWRSISWEMGSAMLPIRTGSEGMRHRGSPNPLAAILFDRQHLAQPGYRFGQPIGHPIVALQPLQALPGRPTLPAGKPSALQHHCRHRRGAGPGTARHAPPRGVLHRPGSLGAPADQPRGLPVLRGQGPQLRLRRRVPRTGALPAQLGLWKPHY
jgi:hypothetical protein